MREVLPNVYWLEKVRGGNVYALMSEGGVTLVDAGLPGQASTVATELEETGRSLAQIRTIVLTHAHLDHTGSAAALARHSGAQVLAHREEVPYVERTRRLPIRSLWRRAVGGFLDRVVLRAPACRVTQALESGDVVDALGGLEVIHAPGHTPGSLCLYSHATRTLFCGDVLSNRNPLTGQEGLKLPPPHFTVDTAQARESVRKLCSLPIGLLCFGHGSPLSGEIGPRLRALLDEVAAPEARR